MGFLVPDQSIVRNGRRRRKHQGCIGCEEIHDQRRANLTTVSSAEMGHQPISSLHMSIFWFGRIGSSRPGRAVSCLHGAQGRVRRGRHTTCTSELDDARPSLDRPSTVQRWQEAVPIIGIVRARSLFLVAAGVTRMAETASAGSVGRALVLYSPAHIHRMEKAGLFPKRVQLGPCRVGWVESEVLEWLQERIRRRETSRPPASKP